MRKQPDNVTNLYKLFVFCTLCIHFSLLNQLPSFTCASQTQGIVQPGNRCICWSCFHRDWRTMWVLWVGTPCSKSHHQYGGPGGIMYAHSTQFRDSQKLFGSDIKRVHSRTRPFSWWHTHKRWCDAGNYHMYPRLTGWNENWGFLKSAGHVLDMWLP